MCHLWDDASGGHLSRDAGNSPILLPSHQLLPLCICFWVQGLALELRKPDPPASPITGEQCRTWIWRWPCLQLFQSLLVTGHSARAGSWWSSVSRFIMERRGDSPLQYGSAGKAITPLLCSVCHPAWAGNPFASAISLKVKNQQKENGEAQSWQSAPSYLASPENVYKRYTNNQRGEIEQTQWPLTTLQKLIKRAWMNLKASGHAHALFCLLVCWEIPAEDPEEESTALWRRSDKELKGRFCAKLKNRHNIFFLASIYS